MRIGRWGKTLKPAPELKISALRTIVSREHEIVISIKRLLNNNSPDTADSLLPVAQLLLDGIGTHAIRSDPEAEAYIQFRESMAQAARQLAECADSREALTEAEASIRLMEEYNRQTAQQLRVRGSELQGMVKMLTTAIGEISTTGEQNVSRLRNIENMVSSVTQVEDVRAVKAQLSLCLDEIRQEATRQKSASSSVVDRLRRDLERAQAGPTSDAVTGLPLRDQATELIASACESGQPVLAAVMAIDRLQAVNAALGPEAGDQLLRYFSGYMRRSLPSEDQLFRWTGASLLALVARPIKIENLRNEIRYLLEQKLEFTARTATRSVRLPVTARWALFPMMASSRLLIRKLDGFAAIQAPND
jgi:GGDEF domain-containing protein